MEKEIIEFGGDIKLIKDLLNTFDNEIIVNKLNVYTILVKMNVDVISFKNGLNLI